MTRTQIEHELSKLPPNERLHIARWLLDTILDAPLADVTEQTNPLLNIAGRFFGGPGDSAERAEEIIAAEVDAQ